VRPPSQPVAAGRSSIRNKISGRLSDRRYCLASIRELPIRTARGNLVKLSQVADVVEMPGQLEMRREDLRQDIAVTARLEGRDLGSAMAEVRTKLGADTSLSAGMIEFGGLYQQQQESFRNLLLVLIMAILLVFTVLLVEFGSFGQPVAIVFGAVLSLFGTIAALWLTDTTLNVVSFLGAIIGVGIVAKNGILMLDLVDHMRAETPDIVEALVRSGRRRLRPVFDDIPCCGTWYAAIGLWGGICGRHAQATRHRGHRRPVLFCAAFADRDADHVLSFAEASNSSGARHPAALAGRVEENLTAR
jgi:Cu/Ag efflux pump CusA